MNHLEGLFRVKSMLWKRNIFQMFKYFIYKIFAAFTWCVILSRTTLFSVTVSSKVRAIFLYLALPS